MGKDKEISVYLELPLGDLLYKFIKYANSKFLVDKKLKYTRIFHILSPEYIT